MEAVKGEQPDLASYEAALKKLSGPHIAMQVEMARMSQEAFADLGGVPVRARPEDLVEEVDLVSIAVPTVAHLEAAAPFLAAGRACLVEKPLAPDPAD